MDFTVHVLQPQANACTPQLLTICFLLIAVCVFTGKLTNVSVLPYCGRRWGKKLPTIQQKTKNCFLPSSYSKYYEPVSLDIWFPDIKWIWHLQLLLFLPRALSLFSHLKCCCSLKIVVNIGTMGAPYFLCQIYSEHEHVDRQQETPWLLWPLSHGGKGICWLVTLQTQISEPAWTVQKWWRVMKESMTHSTENRLCKKSRGSRLLSLVLLLLLRRIYDVVTGSAVSWIRIALLSDHSTTRILLHWLHCFASVLQWADWQSPKLHAKIPAALQAKKMPKLQE